MGLFRTRHRGEGSQPTDEYAHPAGGRDSDRVEPVLSLQIPAPLPGEADRRGKGRHWLLRNWRWLLMAPIYLAVGGGLSVAALFIYYTMVWPDPLALRHKERAPIVRILARDGSLLAQRGAPHDYTPIDLLPQHVRDAVVATEDSRFYEHWGIDPYGLLRASFANLRAGRYAQGGSTLTQQLAKNLFLTPERTLERKLEELLLAFWLEIRLTKNDILELYLNRVYFGAGAYGVEAAARRYFDKSARDLTLAEGALIAGLLKAPSRFSPATSPGAARSRARVVLARMRAEGNINPAAYQRAVSESVRFVEPRQARDDSGVGYAVDFVLERLPPLVGSGLTEVIVETTIDAALQRRVQGVVSETLARAAGELSAGQAAVVVLDTDGGIRALVGGRDYASSQFNRAVRAVRQPGSAFKPVLYLAAAEAGIDPDAVAQDAPFTVQGWTPRNENGTHVGPVTLRQALSTSINTVAVRLQNEIGVQKVIATARRLGIASPLQPIPSLALGTSEVTVIELTGAYSVFAAGGLAVQPHTIGRVRTGSGRIIYERPAKPARVVVQPRHVAAMNDMLAHVMTHGTGRRAQLPGRQSAGKTGTTQDFRDAWFVGYTADLTAGVWIGNDNGSAMNRVMGGSLPAQIWRDVMIAAHSGLPARRLEGAEPVDPRAQLSNGALIAPSPADAVRPRDGQVVPPSGAASRSTAGPSISRRDGKDSRPLATAPRDPIAELLEQGEAPRIADEGSTPAPSPKWWSGLMSLGGSRQP